MGFANVLLDVSIMIKNAFCCSNVTKKDELLQDVYLDEEKYPPGKLNIRFCEQWVILFCNFMVDNFKI